MCCFKLWNHINIVAIETAYASPVQGCRAASCKDGRLRQEAVKSLDFELGSNLDWGDLGPLQASISSTVKWGFLLHALNYRTCLYQGHRKQSLVTTTIIFILIENTPKWPRTMWQSLHSEDDLFFFLVFWIVLSFSMGQCAITVAFKSLKIWKYL